MFVCCGLCVFCPPFPAGAVLQRTHHTPAKNETKTGAGAAGLSSFFDRPSWSEGPPLALLCAQRVRASLSVLGGQAFFFVFLFVLLVLVFGSVLGRKHRSGGTADAYGHTMGNAPDPVRFQKLSLIRHPKY